MSGEVPPACTVTKFFFDGVDDIAGDLRGEYPKVIRQEDENDAQGEAPAVFPEIFVDGLQMLQTKNLSEVTKPDRKNLAVQRETLILRPERWQSGLLRQS